MNVLQVDDAKRDRKSIEYTVRLRPNASNLAQLAANYFTLGETEAALPLAIKSWELNHEPTIGMNLALILKDLGQHEASAQVVQTAYYLNPDDFYIRMGYGESLLRSGNWKSAWPIYDGTRPTQAGAYLDVGLPASVKEWQGEELPKDHLLLVVNEGGTGDRLNYTRWLNELTKRGINWKFYPYKALYSIFERSIPADRLVADGGEITPDPTHCCTTFSLPAKLNAVPTKIPPPLAITASEESIKKYDVFKRDGLPWVAFCYRAAEQHQGNRYFRSLTEGQAMRLVCQLGDKAHWVSLNHENKMPFPVTDVPFETWEDTLGILHHVDAVVTVDTSTFWMANMMGKKTHLLLPGNSDWKFLTRSTKSYWGPTVTYWRNEGRGFEDAINKFVVAVRSGEVSLAG